MAKKVVEERRVAVPDGVTVEIATSRVKIAGPKGVLERDFSHARGVIIEYSEPTREIIVYKHFPNAREVALVGTIAAHIKNMITGVTKGFRYKLKVIFVHFPISVSVREGKLIISNFLGEKTPRVIEIPPGVNVKVSGQDIILEGIDLEKLGMVAGMIERATRVKDKDKRKFMDGIYLYAREVIA
ncbi:MAG: 50S ribosomal protein L6 [Acidilobaceae archaeon]